MAKCLFLTVIFSVLLFNSSTIAQTISSENFKLIIEGRNAKDSTITVEALLKIDKITANYSFLTIHELSIVVAGMCLNTEGVNEIAKCSGNEICVRAKEFFQKYERSMPGAWVIIDCNNATNKSGDKFPLQSIYLKVVK